MGQGNCHPQPGDLIEIDRTLHQHWALYVGDGFVIHVTTEDTGKGDVKLGEHKVPVFTRKVKKQLLKEVVEKDKWRVNNESDQCHTPLPVEQIIGRSEDYIDKEVKYRGFGSNCERFVKKLRYGGQVSAFVSGQVPIPDMTDEDYPKPGDLIEIKRRHYGHWALYMRDRFVIHVTTIGEKTQSLFASSETIHIRKSEVKKEFLRDLAGNDDWKVNNKYDCHRTALPVEKILQCAEQWIGSTVPHGVLGRSSEDFVRKLRYGGQVRAFVGDEVPIPDMTENKDYPKPGDLIEIKRGCYEQWALYVGDGFVIHVTNVEKKTQSLLASSETIHIRKSKVKMELLRDLAGNDDWNVNNKYDCLHTPLPVETILQCAEQWIDITVPHGVLGRSSEDFVRKLRYGGQVMAFVGDEEPIPDMTENKDYPKPGDLIEFKRGPYGHWALYVRDGFVIHVTTIDENSPPLAASSETMLISKAKVKLELLTKVAGKHKWCVNNKYDRYRTPFPAEEIIRRAERWIDRLVLYRLLLRNCEHFVTMLRYGQGVSEQAYVAALCGNAISAAVGLIGAGIYALPVVPPLLAAEVGLIGASIVGIGFGSSNIVHSVTFRKFVDAGENILEQKCC